MRALGIIVLVIVVLALLYLGYKFIFKKLEDGTPCSSTGGSVIDGTIVDGDCIKTQTDQGSNHVPVTEADPESLNGAHNLGAFVTVKESEVVAVSNPGGSFQNIYESNIGSFHLITDDKHTKGNPKKIKFTTQFSKACPEFVWRRNWLYKLVSKVDSTTGTRMCYYKVETSVLPSEIKITLLPTKQASIFKFFVSGAEYRYSTTQVTHPAQSLPISYAVYEKQ